MEARVSRKRLDYDDEALVEMIAEGQLTYRAIGERLGISESLIKKIARGRKRKDLARRLWDAENGILTEARRIGVRYARNLVMEQVRLGLTGEGEPARRAREFLLKFTATSRPRRSDLPEEHRRPERLLQDIRGLGIAPWEDDLDAEREEEAGEGITCQPTGSTGRQAAENAENAEGEEDGEEASRGDGDNGNGGVERPAALANGAMAAAGLEVCGPEVPAGCPGGVPQVSSRCP